MPKISAARSGAAQQSRNMVLQRKPKSAGEKSSSSSKHRFDGVRTEDTEFIDSKTTRKIFEVAREQQTELEQELRANNDNQKDGDQNERKTSERQMASSAKIALELSGEYSDREEDDEVIIDPDDCAALDENEESTQNYYESYYAELKINKQDERALELFMTKDNLKRKTLADYIQDKLRQKDDELSGQLHESDADGPGLRVADLDNGVIELYRGVRLVLSRYRSGKLPKAFKIIPSFANWEQILHITEPDTWSAAAMFQATRIFTSNLKEKMAQRFYNLILLPRIRDDIEEYRRLNFHLYQALRKSLFKPGAFFKGIVLPLCEAGDCTLREAIIVGSVMGRNHIPLLHSCAAMLKIAEMDYTGANSIFLHILINKKYALPYRVVDAMFAHFYRFANDRRALPVLWHQCLLAFVQIYRNDLSNEQKECLLELLREQAHHAISPVIRRQLMHSLNRDGTTFAATDDARFSPEDADISAIDPIDARDNPRMDIA